MNDIARLTKQGVADSPRKGFWVHAGDLNQKIEQGQLREAALQQRLTAADERVDLLEGWLREAATTCRVNDLVISANYFESKLKPADGPEPTTCTWSSHAFSWESTCGMTGWEFTDGGTPGENGMKFCHCCGKTLVVEGVEDE